MDDTAIANAARRWYVAEMALRQWKNGAMDRWRAGVSDGQEDIAMDAVYRIAGSARAGLWLLLEADAKEQATA